VENRAVSITTVAGALDAARAQGFVEAVFTFHEPEHVLDEIDGEANAVRLWGDECAADGRHGVIVGQVPEAFFVMVILRSETSDMLYSLEEMREVFRRHLDEEPKVNSDEPDEEVWVGPRTSHETALAVARELVAIDRRERDPDAELALGITNCSP
jgi:hypothetical protein